MAQYDLPLPELRAYAPDLPAPADLDIFWATTLAEARAHDLAATFRPVDSGLTVIESFDVSYAGFGGSRVQGWLHLPRRRAGALPAVVEYAGYGGGRGLAHERVLWATAGYAHLVMDTRGQGSSWAVGDTPDPHKSGEPSHPGFMTQGIRRPATFYFRRLITDAVRAIDAVRDHPDVDRERVAVTGASQGGGLALAAGSLADGLIGVMADVPFLCDFPRAITLNDTDPYAEIGRYLKTHRDQVEEVLTTLSYFDMAILDRRATAAALFSVGLMDLTCPPSTVYAAFNRYGGPKAIVEYPFNDHEGGQGFHDLTKIRWLQERLSVPSR